VGVALSVWLEAYIVVLSISIIHCIVFYLLFVLLVMLALLFMLSFLLLLLVQSYVDVCCYCDDHPCS